MMSFQVYLNCAIFFYRTCMDSLFLENILTIYHMISNLIFSNFAYKKNITFNFISFGKFEK